MDKKIRTRIVALSETLRERARAWEQMQPNQPVGDAAAGEAAALHGVAQELDEWVADDIRREKRQGKMSLLRGLASFLLLMGLLAFIIFAFFENSLLLQQDYFKVVRHFFPDLQDKATYAEYLQVAVAGCLGLMTFLIALIVAMFLELFIKLVRIPMNALIFSLLTILAAGVMLYYYINNFEMLRDLLYRFV